MHNQIEKQMLLNQIAAPAQVRLHKSSAKKSRNISFKTDIKEVQTPIQTKSKKQRTTVAFGSSADRSTPEQLKACPTEKDHQLESPPCRRLALRSDDSDHSPTRSRPKTAEQTFSIISATEHSRSFYTHKSFVTGRFFQGGTKNQRQDQPADQQSQPPSPGVKGSQVTLRTLRQRMTQTFATSEEFPDRPYHTDYQKQYLVKKSQLPASEINKLKAKAEEDEQTKRRRLEIEQRQEQEFMQLKVRHLTTVNDRRAVVMGTAPYNLSVTTKSSFNKDPFFGKYGRYSETLNNRRMLQEARRTESNYRNAISISVAGQNVQGSQRQNGIDYLRVERERKRKERLNEMKNSCSRKSCRNLAEQKRIYLQSTLPFYMSSLRGGYYSPSQADQLGKQHQTLADPEKRPPPILKPPEFARNSDLRNSILSGALEASPQLRASFDPSINLALGGTPIKKVKHVSQLH